MAVLDNGKYRRAFRRLTHLSMVQREFQIPFRAPLESLPSRRSAVELQFKREYPNGGKKSLTALYDANWVSTLELRDTVEAQTGATGNLHDVPTQLARDSDNES